MSAAIPQIECERHHASLIVPDVPTAATWYIEKLGFKMGFTWGDPATFAGIDLGEVRIFIQEGAASPGSAAIYFLIGDADELYEFHRANGVTVVEPPGDRVYDLRDYTIKDLHGYALTFGQYLPSKKPALPIERVDVPVRLEKRLAALLTDLAARKNMSVSSALEETLLHSFEPIGDAVASPHTKADLRYIEELKTKHGIDYDCHASYRFVEKE